MRQRPCPVPYVMRQTLRFSCDSRQEEGWYESCVHRLQRLNKLTIFDPQPMTPPADISKVWRRISNSQRST
ncbi:hypothetical protein PoB_001904200 [Plakobranchus ocellatus]|uniref:Uncharacterized protein n=1 Tax=Plakobranchus ocellatus TaxID=259542 RepID=A0AAV3ZBA0_9GAST|nr:hypothetical protein PoB_001904200 [Plakobranchus ocellatus]